MVVRLVDPRGDRVSILVFLDDPLRESTSIGASISALEVSILVFLDDPLRERDAVFVEGGDLVSILVFLDDPLRACRRAGRPSWLARFNPCFSG